MQTEVSQMNNVIDICSACYADTYCYKILSKRVIPEC